MLWVFWSAVGVILYTYLGYPVWLSVRALWSRHFVQTRACFPTISIVMVVRDEAKVLERKIRNLMEVEYPPDRREIVIVSDGSTDDTNPILLKKARESDFKVILNPQPKGKAAGINDAMKVVRGEVIVFTDARQIIEPESVRLLMESFADPVVGCVSGELMLGDPQAGDCDKGMGLYWKIEKRIRKMESTSGSVVGATGALYAVRRALIVTMPEETILDDVYIPLHVVQKGARVLFDSRARAWDVADQGQDTEFARKVRTLSGNYQLLRLAPWILTRSNPIRFEFISHKLARLVLPFALAMAFITAALLSGPIYQTALILQVVFYAVGLWALLRPSRWPRARFSDVSSTFILLNAAAVVAFANFVFGRKVAWQR